jgi:hypothetical protein
VIEIYTDDAVCGGQGGTLNVAAGQSTAREKRYNPLQKLGSFSTLKMFLCAQPGDSIGADATEGMAAHDRLRLQSGAQQQRS